MNMQNSLMESETDSYCIEALHPKMVGFINQLFQEISQLSIEKLLKFLNWLLYHNSMI